MSVDLIAAALIIAFAGIVALGHVLVVAAIYKCLREDYAGGQGQRTANGTTTADDGAKRTAGAVSFSETLEPQGTRAFGARGLLRSARPGERHPAALASRGPRCGDQELRTTAPGFPE
jgi:hypothetical protein